MTFTETTLVRLRRFKDYTGQDHTPVVLEEIKMPVGKIGYYGAVKDFRIPEKVSEALPPAVRMRKEMDLGFGFRCVPQYESELSLKLKIIVRPMQNPEGGIEWSC